MSTVDWGEKYIRILRGYPVVLWLSNFEYHIKGFSFISFLKGLLWIFISLHTEEQRWKQNKAKNYTHPRTRVGSGGVRAPTRLAGASHGCARAVCLCTHTHTHTYILLRVGDGFSGGGGSTYLTFIERLTVSPVVFWETYQERLFPQAVLFTQESDLFMFICSLPMSNCDQSRDQWRSLQGGQRDF